MDDKLVLKNNLKAIRLEKNISQQQLADILGSKPTTVASWEQGKSLPSIDMLYRLSKYYGKTIAQMYGEE